VLRHRRLILQRRFFSVLALKPDVTTALAMEAQALAVDGHDGHSNVPDVMAMRAGKWRVNGV